MMLTRTMAADLRALLAAGPGDYTVTSDPAGYDAAKAGPVVTVGAPQVTFDPAVCPGPMYSFPVYVTAAGIDRAAVDALYDAVDAVWQAVTGSTVFTLVRADPQQSTTNPDRPPTYVVEVRV